MKTAEIQKAIEAQHWDYPPSLIPKNVAFIHTSDVIMIKNKAVANIQANKVIHFTNFQKLNTVFDFFGDLPFSWWVPSNQQQLIDTLNSYHFSPLEKYVGFALHINDFQIPYTKHSFSIVDVKDDDHIRKLVDVSAAIWSYAESQKANLFQQRKDYINACGEQGGYTICMDGEKAVAYSNYRYSQDRKTMYLNGAGVLPSYRKRGIYKELVYKRLQAAKEKGILFATALARTGHSAPVLARLGFQEHTTYLQFTRNEKE